MATVNPTIRHIGNDTVKFTYALTTADNDGAPIGPNHADYADRNVQVLGNLGGGSVAIQGSNDEATTWFSVDDPQGLDLSLSAAGGKAISEVTEHLRPLLSGSTGAACTVIITCRRSRSAALS